jgi:hypothetical protein
VIDEQLHICSSRTKSGLHHLLLRGWTSIVGRYVDGSSNAANLPLHRKPAAAEWMLYLAA